MMIMWFVICLAMIVNVSAAGVPLPRKVVLNGDNLEILRLDIMSAEVRVSNNVKEMADRVEDALARHGAKLVQGGSPTPHPFSSRPHFVCKFSRQRSTEVF